jgi:hypothetical protein
MITAAFNFWDGGDVDALKGGFKTLKELSAIVFWVIIVIGAYYAILIVFLDVIHAFQETSKFYDYIQQEIIQNKFNFVQHTAEFFDFQNNLVHLQNIANIFLVPCVGLCLSACAVGLFFEIFGFEARFSAVSIGRFSIKKMIKMYSVYWILWNNGIQFNVYVCFGDNILFFQI